MLLEKLSNAFGVSSVEDEVRTLIVEAIQPHADTLHTDTMGNLFATRRARRDGPQQGKRVMVTAHMDEVGLMITKINSNGHLKFQAVGGLDRRILPGKPVVVGKDKKPGVIGVKPVHLVGRSDETKVGPLSSMFIDIGATDDKGGGIKPGDFATFATAFSHFEAGDNGAEPSEKTGRVSGKAMDNRVGCAMLVELLKEDYPFELAAVFTVQEEIGLRGARVAAYTADPAVAFILECTAADDVPKPDKPDDPNDGIPRLGLGPALTVMDRRFIADRGLLDLLIETAEADNIPYQYKRPGIGGTDAGAIHTAREGVPSAVISVPARYIHAPAAIIDLGDFWHTVQLVHAALLRLDLA